MPDDSRRPHCIVGIDPGARWLGIARAAGGSSLALPVGTLDRSSAAPIADALRQLLNGDVIDALVVGVPLRPDGSEDRQAAAFREFGQQLAAQVGAQCIAQDERDTSEPPASLLPASADRDFHGKARRRGRKSVGRRRKEREHAHAQAAARILQRWLDQQRGECARAQSSVNHHPANASIRHT